MTYATEARRVRARAPLLRLTRCRSTRPRAPMRGRGTRTGFYYICLDSETGGILGFYYHQAPPCPARSLSPPRAH